MRYFRRKSDGTTTEQKKAKSKEPKKVERVKIECSQCGYSLWVTFINEKEISKTLKDNGWIDDGETKHICPRCIALRNESDR